VLRCIGFGLRPRWSSCRRSERWWSWYPAPCLGPSDSYPFPVPSRWGTLSVFELPTGAVSGGRVRYPDLCFLLDSGVSWFPGHVGIPGSDCCGSLCSISSASFWCLPGSRAVHGGCGWGVPGFRRAPNRVVHRILLPLGCCPLWGAGSRLASGSVFDGGSSPFLPSASGVCVPGGRFRNPSSNQDIFVSVPTAAIPS
jgi:hypothetical protein